MSTKKKEKVKALLLEQYETKVIKPMNDRLDSIEQFCQKSLKEQNDRSKAIHGFIVREVQYNIQNQLYNMRVTMDAFVEVVNAEGIKIENLSEKIDAKKKEISERLQKEAEARMAERMSADSEAKEEEVKPEEEKQKEEAKVEQPAEEPATSEQSATQ